MVGAPLGGDSIGVHLLTGSRTASAPADLHARDDPYDGWLCSPDMTHLTAMTAAHATDRFADWQTALRAEDKSPSTVAIYADGAARYLNWCAERDHLPMSRARPQLLGRRAARHQSRARNRPHPTARRTPLRGLAHRRARDPGRPVPGVKAPRAWNRRWWSPLPATSCAP